MKSYLDYATLLGKMFADAGKIVPPQKTAAAADIIGKPDVGAKAPSPEVLVFSPHPDDECITGLLPLRLMRECGARITDIAVTLGSKLSRRAERKAELQSACAYLGWEMHVCGGGNGFDNVRLQTRTDAPSQWAGFVDEIAEILKARKPAAIFAPHFDDWNGTHVGTAYLVADAVEKSGYAGTVFQTEYWGGLKSANLAAEGSPEYLAAQMGALARHTKEVERNDYHLRLPAWQIDNVRRGAEIVGGQGAQAPHFTFATLYNAVKFENGKWRQAFAQKFLPLSEKPPLP